MGRNKAIIELREEAASGETSLLERGHGAVRCEYGTKVLSWSRLRQSTVSQGSGVTRLEKQQPEMKLEIIRKDLNEKKKVLYESPVTVTG